MAAAGQFAAAAPGPRDRQVMTSPLSPTPPYDGGNNNAWEATPMKIGRPPRRKWRHV